MPAANIIELRQLLAERFPGLRTRAEELGRHSKNRFPTGLPQLDELPRGGLPEGSLTEMIAAERGSGSGLVMVTLIRRALSASQFVAVIDGKDSLDVAQLDADLSRLLWVRCRAADEALKAADLLLRDGNLPLVFLDLVGNPAAQLRRIPATAWFRLQRIVEQTSTVCIVVTPRPMVSPAVVRITLKSRFSLKALERNPDELMRELKMEISEASRVSEERESAQRSA